jgi:lysozyme family protein
MAIRFTIAHEGGLVNDPADPGGLTKWGISQRAYPGLDIAALTQADAWNIYRRDYWERLGLDRPAIPGAVGIATFDAAVNLGRRRAAKLLQGACNLLGCQPPLVRDGVLGPKTRATVRALAALNSERAALLALLVNTRRLRFYQVLTGIRPSQIKFLRGWLARVVALNELLILRQMGAS